MRTRSIPLVLVVALGLGAPAASDAPSRDSDADPAGTPIAAAPTLHGALALSLQEAIAMGIENNLDVEIERHDPLIASQEHRAAWGAYDPELFGDYSWASTDTPIASSLQTGDKLVERDLLGSGGVAGLVPKLGASYEIAYRGRRLTTNSSIQSLSPEYTVSLAAQLSIPLLRGLFWGEPWVQVKVTDILEREADDEFRRQLMDTARDIEDAYWQLVAAAEQLRVDRKSLEATQALRDQTQAQYEVGVVSRVEVVEADAGVAEREVNLIVADNQYRGAQDRLIDLVLGPHLTATSSLEIRPTDEPEVVDYQVNPDEATSKAFEFRPELAAARKEVERQRILFKFAKNQRLPQLDVVGSYGYAGLSGRTNPAPPPSFGDTPTARPEVQIGRRYSSADDDFFSGDGARQQSIGAIFSIPIGNVRARADVSRSRLELRRANTAVRRLEQSIVLEVRDAVRNLRSTREGIEAAERRRLAAEEQHRAESIRLEHGESTPFDVLQRERDLVDAESQKISALQGYRASITALDRAQGTILRNRNVVVEDARRLR